MQLLAPLSLIALAPLAGIIILLYLLRLRRRDVVVPSVFLWRRAVQDVQANTPFQKLRRNLLLVLQLAALTSLIAALAGPYLMISRLGGTSTVIVLDASASMQARDANGTRFEEGRRRVREIVNGMGRRDEAALVICSDRARVALPFTRDRGRLLAAVDGERPTDCSTNVRDGLLLALSLAGKRSDPRVYLISDGGFPALPAVTSSADIRFLAVGTRNDNVAILAFETALRSESQEHEIFLRVHNYAPERKEGVLAIYHEDVVIEARPIVLAPGETVADTYRVVLQEEGLLRAELEVVDDLAADNVAYAFVRPPSVASVLLVTPGNLFLEQALVVLPEVDVYKTGALDGPEGAAAYRDYDVVIYDRVAVSRPPESGAVMLIAPSADLEVASVGVELEVPAISRWEEEHDVLLYVNLGAVQIAEARALVPAPGAQAIAYAGDEPVMVALDSPGLRALSFGWSFLESDLPLRVGFPVLLSNAIQWLSRNRGGFAPARVQPGTILTFSAPPEVEEAEALLPNGERLQVAVVDGSIDFSATERVGVYGLSAGEKHWRWAVDLRDPRESDLTPSAELRLGEQIIAAATGSPKLEQHLWPLLVVLALAVLLGEWHLYHRRY